jgi:aspartyl-tRNA(Asn)/glutamyl-tRNA(Gln) amidotransferase subunit A
MSLPDSLTTGLLALRTGRTTSAAMVEASLDAIARLNPDTNAFIRVDTDRARQAAAQADRERAEGPSRGLLHGLPISLKDLIDEAGLTTTAASEVFADHVATADAPVTSRLAAAGAISLGKTNLHEFALGTTSEDSAFGPVRNPHDLTRSAGGSSGGSAVAVATGMGLASIGTDTGGSVRIPAAACGVVGLKPSLRDVPTDGVVSLSRSLDHVGPLTRTVEDAKLLWAVLADRPYTPTQAPHTSSMKIAVLRGYFDHPLEPAVRQARDKALDVLRAAGVTLVDAEVPGTASITEAYVNIVLPEGAAWHADWLDEKADLYSPAVRDRLRAGRDITAVSYLKARQTRRILTAAVDTLLADVDALLLPTLPIVAPLIGATSVTMDGVEMLVRAAMLKHTQLFNITGHPAITLPLSTNGLPVGLQLVGRRNETSHLLDVAAACESLLCR